MITVPWWRVAVTDLLLQRRTRRDRQPIVELALCGVAVGRRNFLSAGADSGGERAAAIYSLIGTMRLNVLDPEIYLAYVLEHLQAS